MQVFIVFFYLTFIRYAVENNTELMCAKVLSHTGQSRILADRE